MRLNEALTECGLLSLPAQPTVVHDDAALQGYGLRF